jgi:hypothetical protein
LEASTIGLPASASTANLLPEQSQPEELIPFLSSWPRHLNGRENGGILMIGSIIAGPALEQALTMSSLAMSFIQYGSLLGGIGVYVLFWFAKRNEIEIMAPTATIGGIPRSYEEADKFCVLLVSELEDQPRATNKGESEAASSPKAADHDWRL